MVLSKIETTTTLFKQERVQNPCIKRCKYRFRGVTKKVSGDHIVDTNKMVAIALRYIGSRNPTGVRGKWCKAFINKVLREAGYKHNRSNRARDAQALGTRITSPIAGALIITHHHVEIALGNGRSISGNWGGRVQIHPTQRGVIIAPERG